MPLRALVVTAVLLLSGVGVASAAPARLGTPETLASFGEGRILAAGSAQGHGTAYAVFDQVIGANRYTVLFSDTRGRRHRFRIATARGTFPYAVRLVALEDGGGMALWDESSTQRLLARSWDRTGALGPVQTVLDGVQTVGRGDNDYAKWSLRDDGRGTVVVATTGLRQGDPAAVVAALRDPGGAFGRQQRLDPGDETAPSYDREVQLSAIDPDGTLTASWPADSGGTPGGAARRVGRAATFVPVPLSEAPASIPSRRGGRTVTGSDGRPIALTARLARLCPCLRPQVFTWSGGTSALVFQRYDGRTRFSRSWFVARGDATGRFDGGHRATRRAQAVPVRRARPGEMGFAVLDPGSRAGVSGGRQRLVEVPYGSAVPRSRRAPRLRLGSGAFPRGSLLLVPISCDRTCTLEATSPSGRRLRLTSEVGSRSAARLEPVEIAYVRARPGDRGLVRLRLQARDDAGRTTRERATYRDRGPRRGWCRVGTRGC